METVRTHLPELQLSGLAAGFHAILRLPAGTDEPALVAAARMRSVDVNGISAHCVSGRASAPALVIGFGNIDEDGLREAIAIIAHLIAAR